MSKIFFYELKRIIINKLFLGIMLIIIYYGLMLLSNDIIQGISYTAPFSAWSYGYYLSNILPFICICELFFISFYSSGNEKRVAEIINASLTEKNKLIIIRSGAIFVATVILTVVVVLLAVIFIYSLFGTVLVGEMIMITLVVLLPVLLFCMGLGWLSGKIHQRGIYIIMCIILLFSFSKCGFSLDNYFKEWPLQQEILEPPFCFTIQVLLNRVIYALIGICTFLSCFVEKNIFCREKK